jgi:hypothetical protein
VSQRLTPLGLLNAISKDINLLDHTAGELEATKPLGSLLGLSDSFVELFGCDDLYFGVEN